MSLSANKSDPDETTLSAATLLDRLQRLQADFENYRKRVEKEKARMEDKARSELLQELLPAFDALEQATATPPPDATDVQAYHEGIRAVERQFHAVFDQAGVERMRSLGQRFDPRIHEAVGLEPPTAEYPDGVICRVLQEGYIHRGELMRSARVIVAGNDGPSRLDVRV